MGLPVNVYTEWYWKCDLHNTLRFLSLRMDAHAQQRSATTPAPCTP
jgi:thymidylate synthase (FAD)